MPREVRRTDTLTPVQPLSPDLNRERERESGGERERERVGQTTDLTNMPTSPGQRMMSAAVRNLFYTTDQWHRLHPRTEDTKNEVVSRLPLGKTKRKTL